MYLICVAIIFSILNVNGQILIEKTLTPVKDSFEDWNDPPNKHAAVARKVVHKSG